MDLIDTHCHLDIDCFAPELPALLQKAREAGVTRMVLPGVDRAGWAHLLRLCRQTPGLFAAPGLHPLYLTLHQADDLAELDALAGSGAIVAIGEIGLDYYHDTPDRRTQQWYFEEQLRLAACHHLPILLHIRKAHDQVLATLRRHRFSHGGIVHAYNGSLQQAQQFTALGFGISVCGTITYTRARRIRNTLLALPAETLVLETDAPDIPLASHRGTANRPEYLPEVLYTLAELRGEDAEFLASITTSNAERLLGLTAG